MADKELTITIKVKDAAGAAIEKLKQKISGMRQIISQAFSGTDVGADKLRASIDRTGVAIDKLKQKTSGAKQTISQTFTGADTGADKLKISIDQVGNAADKLKQKAGGVGDKISEEMSQAAAATKKYEQTLASFEAKFVAMKQQMEGARALGIQGPGYANLAQIREQESLSMLGQGSAASNLRAAQAANQAKELRQLAAAETEATKKLKDFAAAEALASSQSAAASANINKLQATLSQVGTAADRLKQKTTGMGQGVATGMNQAAAGVDRMKAATAGAGSTLANMKTSWAGTITAISTGYMAAVQAIGMITNAAKQFIDAAIESSRAWGTFQNTIEMIGVGTEETIGQFQELASALMELTGTSDEEFAEIGRKVLMMTQDVDKAKYAMMAVADLMSTGMFRSSRGAIDAITEALEGNSQKLENALPFFIKYKTELNGISDPAARAQRALEIMNDEIGGAAGKMDESARALTAYNQKMDELKEKIGGAILPSLTEFAKGLEVIIDYLLKLNSQEWVIKIKMVKEGAEEFLGVDDPNTLAGSAYRAAKDMSKFIITGGSLNLYEYIKNLGAQNDNLEEAVWLTDKLRERTLGFLRERGSLVQQQFNLESELQKLEQRDVQRQYAGQAAYTPAQELAQLNSLMRQAQTEGAPAEQINKLMSLIVEARGAQQESSAEAIQSEDELQQVRLANQEELASAQQAAAQELLSFQEQAARELAQQEQQYAQQIIDLQNQVTTAREEGFRQGSNEMKSYMESAYSEASRLYDQEHEINAELSASNYELEKSLALQTQLAEISEYMARIDISPEERLAAQEQLNRLVRMAATDTAEATQHFIEMERAAAQMENALGNVTGLQAESHILLTEISLLESGLVTDFQEYASLTNSVHGSLEGIADRFNVSVERAKELLPILQNMSDEGINLMETTASFAEQFEVAERQRRGMGMLGLEGGPTYATLAQLRQREVQEYLGKGMGILSPEVRAAAAGARQYQALADAEQAAKTAGGDAAGRLSDQLYTELTGAVSSALEAGFEQGGRAAVDSFATYLKNKIKKEAFDALSEAIVGPMFGRGGGGGTTGGLLGMFTGRGGGAAPTGGQGLVMAQAASAAVSGLQPGQLRAQSGGIGQFWGMLAGQTQGAAPETGGGGIMGGGGGLLGPLGPYLGAAMFISGLFKKGPGAPRSGVAPLPQYTGAQFREQSLGVLRGSSYYERAAFSSRGMAGDMALNRLGGPEKIELDINVKAGGMFDAEIATRTTEAIKVSAANGTPRRTGFTH